MSYGSRCCYSVSIEVQQPPTHKPYSYSFLKAKILEIFIFIKINLSNSYTPGEADGISSRQYSPPPYFYPICASS